MKGAKPNLSNVVPMAGGAKRRPPSPPEFMSDEARNVWEHLAQGLVDKDRLEPGYEFQFSVYCEAVSNFIAATICLQQEGLYYETKTRNGIQQKKRAAFGIQQEASAKMAQIGALFGLSPVDANRLGNGVQGDLFEDMMAKINGTD